MQGIKDFFMINEARKKFKYSFNYKKKDWKTWCNEMDDDEIAIIKLIDHPELEIVISTDVNASEDGNYRHIATYDSSKQILSTIDKTLFD